MVDWLSRAKGVEFESMGEDSVGFNTILGGFRNDKDGAINVESTIRGGLDFMQCCTMSGAHQMDLRIECDWSDPYVLGGGIARAAAQTFFNRTQPNAIGVHFYDEPGLTWGGDTNTPFTVPAQWRSFESAFGSKPMHPTALNPEDPQSRDQWSAWQRWHYGFLEAAWKNSAFTVNYIKSDFLPIVQSVYGFTCYADGYYFNVVRPLPLISGHGGYSDGIGGYMYSAYHMEYGRMRDLNKPYWYLPSWYGMDSNNYRLEQFLSFQNGIQGMMKPPDYQVQSPATCNNAEGIIEANKVQLRLGTIFTTMPVTRPEVAVLFSMSQILDGEMTDLIKKDITGAAYDGGGHSRGTSLMTYMAGKMIHVPFFPIVEEDILDGTLAKNHKVLILPGINTLEPKVKAAVQSFIKGGGVVLISDDAKVTIEGAKLIGAKLDIAYYRKAGNTWGSPDYWILNSFGNYTKVLTPFANALAARLREAGITPVINTDSPGLIASRQAQGDIEYIFTVNATHDDDGNMNDTKPIETTIGLPNDGRPVYDAVHGGEVAFIVRGNQLTAKFRYGPGQMRAFARTRKPISGVQVLPAVQYADYTLIDKPIYVKLTAILMGNDNRIISGSAPLEITVVDPLGAIRYNLYRATECGVWKMELPLAANDPAGEWQVTVRELLSGKEEATAFTYTPTTSCGALMGTSERAVMFPADRENIYRFFQLHKDITLVTGSGTFNTVAAERLTSILAPWGVRCTTKTAAELNKARTVPEEAKKSWCGMDPGRPDFANPAVSQLGFAVDGPVILLGTPEDNPLMLLARDRGFLPYRPAKDIFPGRGRGYLCWQDDAVGYFNQESVSVIAYDQTGMDEAVGTLYEICAGLTPLMAYTVATTNEVQPATEKVVSVPAPKIVWTRILPDRILGMTLDGEKLTVVTNDGSVLSINAVGEVKTTRVLSLAEAVKLGSTMVSKLDDTLVKKVAAQGYLAKKTIPLGELTAIGYWGGLCQVVDTDGKLRCQQLFPTDINTLAVLNGKLVVGLADGTTSMLEVIAAK